MTRIIAVKPVGEGWSVQADAFDSEMMFLSGAKAEAAARRLAKTLARNGESSEIHIFLRDGALAGQFAVRANLALTG
ncbi:MAG: hypothetical protein JWO72_3347 [Caulobacteraceae bacterium]|nr:hypothetical protein [Caulobacteraceae bacterium]